MSGMRCSHGKWFATKKRRRSRISAEHDGYTDQGRNGSCMRMSRSMTALPSEIENRRGRIPPAAHRLLQPEERSDGEREETHRGKNDVGEDAIEGTEA